VLVGAGVGALGDSTETVQVELALEGGQLGVAEVEGEDLGHETGWVHYREGCASGEPGYDGRVGV